MPQRVTILRANSVALKVVLDPGRVLVVDENFRGAAREQVRKGRARVRLVVVQLVVVGQLHVTPRAPQV